LFRWKVAGPGWSSVGLNTVDEQAIIGNSNITATTIRRMATPSRKTVGIGWPIVGNHRSKRKPNLFSVESQANCKSWNSK